MSPLPRRAAAAAVALVLTAAPASAHLVQTGFGAFYDGLVHLVATPADLLVVLGLGLLAGLCGKPAARTTLLALPAAWLAAGLLGRSVPQVGELALATTATLVVVGGLVACDARLSRGQMLGLAVAVGALHGLANGATLAPGGAEPLALCGAALAAFTLASLVPARVVGLRAAWQRIAVRVAGSWIAAIGVLLLGWLARPG